MTQEGQALPSPTPPENPAEPITAAATTDPPAETHCHLQPNTQLVARASEDLEEAKQQQQQQEEERPEGEEEAHRGGEERASDEGGEGDVEEKKLDSASGENQQTGVRVEGESEGTRGDGCADMVVISTSMGEGAALIEVEKMDGGEEEEKEEGKDNEERHPPAEDPQQAERWVHCIIFIHCCCPYDV